MSVAHGQKCKKRAPLQTTIASKPKLGRPSNKTPELIDEICYRVSTGRSVASVAADDDMPEQGVLYRWRLEDSVFHEKLELAREERREVTRQKLIDIGDRVISDPHLDPNRVNAAAHAWAKAEALSATKQRLQVSGHVEVSDVTDTEIVRRIAFLFNKIESENKLATPKMIEATAIAIPGIAQQED